MGGECDAREKYHVLFLNLFVTSAYDKTRKGQVYVYKGKKDKMTARQEMKTRMLFSYLFIYSRIRLERSGVGKVDKTLGIFAATSVYFYYKLTG